MTVSLTVFLNRAEEQEAAGALLPHRDHVLMSMSCGQPYLNVTGEVSLEQLRDHVAQCKRVLAEMEFRASATTEDLT